MFSISLEKLSGKKLNIQVSYANKQVFLRTGKGDSFRLLTKKEKDATKFEQKIMLRTNVTCMAVDRRENDWDIAAESSCER